jgi:hypothetical protein
MNSKLLLIKEGFDIKTPSTPSEGEHIGECADAPRGDYGPDVMNNRFFGEVDTIPDRTDTFRNNVDGQTTQKGLWAIAKPTR